MTLTANEIIRIMKIARIKPIEKRWVLKMSLGINI